MLCALVLRAQCQLALLAAPDHPRAALVGRQGSSGHPPRVEHRQFLKRLPDAPPPTSPTAVLIDPGSVCFAPLERDALLCEEVNT